MNTSNKLTILRLILIIPIVILLNLKYFLINIVYFTSFSFSLAYGVNILLNIIIFGLFLIASISDYYDGKLARERNEVTDFGKLYDPVADKLLVFSILITLVKYQKISLILVLILLAREIFITSYRALYATKGNGIISADTLGKYKTLAQMVAIGIILLFGTGNILNTLLMLPSLLLSILSAVDYVRSNPIV